MYIIYFLIGLVLIIKGADWLTDGASSIARRYNVSSLVIGLTIVAFGTSAPELIVSVVSSIENKSALAIGNVVGSNMFNTLAIMGLTAIVFPVVCTKSNRIIDIPLCILASLVLLIMTSDNFLWGSSENNISRWEGIILLALAFGYFAYTFYIGKRNRHSDKPEPNVGSKPEMAIWKASLLFLVGLGCLVFGGELFVDGASKIAEMIGVSQSVIGLTIVAAGTSFPELMTSIIAARKGDTDMAMGNVIGSNVLNIFLVLGVSSTINPLSMGNVKAENIIILLGSSVLLLLFSIFDRNIRIDGKITSPEGAILTLCAIAYYTWVVMTN